VTENGGEAKTMEFNGKEGKATVDVGKKTVTEAEVGVPVYPGATAELTGNYAATGQQESVQHTMLTTPDSFDKVAAFYKANLKNVGASTVQDMGGNGKVAMFQVKGADGSEIAVNIIADKDKEATKIQIVKTQKAK